MSPPNEVVARIQDEIFKTHQVLLSLRYWSLFTGVPVEGSWWNMGGRILILVPAIIRQLYPGHSTDFSRNGDPHVSFQSC